MILVYIIPSDIITIKSFISFGNGTWICHNEGPAENWRNMHTFQERKKKFIKGWPASSGSLRHCREWKYALFGHNRTWIMEVDSEWDEF